jgi:hypothetical protein
VRRLERIHLVHECADLVRGHEAGSRAVGGDAVREHTGHALDRNRVLSQHGLELISRQASEVLGREVAICALLEGSGQLERIDARRGAPLVRRLARRRDVDEARVTAL